MRRAEIYYNDVLAGILTETDDGEYRYEYEKTYVQNFPDQFLTFTMPVVNQVFISNQLFPFFEGLIPEGWFLEIASKSWKISRNDRMGLLLACCRNCVGAASVKPLAEESDE